MKKPINSLGNLAAYAAITAAVGNIGSVLWTQKPWWAESAKLPESVITEPHRAPMIQDAVQVGSPQGGGVRVRVQDRDRDEASTAFYTVPMESAHSVSLPWRVGISFVLFIGAVGFLIARSWRKAKAEEL